MWEMVCDKVVCVCECVSVCGKVWYVKLLYVCVWVCVCGIVIVCERWYVTKCGKVLYMKVCVCVGKYCIVVCVWVSVCVWESIVYESIVCDDKVVCVWVSVSVCVIVYESMYEGGGGRRRRRRRRSPGIQTQKQEPHTKLWGKTFLLRNYIEPKLFFAEITLCRNYPVLELSCSWKNPLQELSFAGTILL